MKTVRIPRSARREAEEAPGDLEEKIRRRAYLFESNYCLTIGVER
jgi:hypothetical protein